ncbi:hypothetical protein BDP67DRAFT_568836 [Colletotrichum lupini]|nr:hypothetical protein BDP67DRAFT_568836 [Colletotrichum lupini]
MPSFMCKAVELSMQVDSSSSRNANWYDCPLRWVQTHQELSSSSNIDLASLLQVTRHEASSDNPGYWTVYLHVIWNESNESGVYAGQTRSLKKRIQCHLRTYRDFQQKFEAEPDLDEHKSLPPYHTIIWVLNGKHDAWLKFAQIPAISDEFEEDRQHILLTIIEGYAVHVLRTLSRGDCLLHTLHSSYEVRSYAWDGLNTRDPLCGIPLKFRLSAIEG